MSKKPPLWLQTTTLWDYPSRTYGRAEQGDNRYQGATPAWVIWNLLTRYTQPKDVVLDPMVGSGTTLDVCQDLDREGIGLDLVPFREGIRQGDARSLPLKKNTVDFVFVDPPYSTHIDYSDHGKCIGKLDASEPEYYEAMEQVIREIHRVLRPGKFMALLVSDSFVKGRPLMPIGFALFGLLSRYFSCVDIVVVARHHRNLKKGHWHKSAIEGNYFLRGFHYLFIMKKSAEEGKK